jgi:formyl-CoA transferase
VVDANGDKENRVLEAMRVLDLTWVLGGPYAGQLLGQLGAEVIKVESPAGDPARAIPPHFFHDDSSFFLSVNRGKSGVAIDLKTEEGLQAFYDLVRVSDAVIYGYAPDVPKRLRIDYESLREINPRICVGQMIGLHDADGYERTPAYDLIAQALGGVMSITGAEGGPPARVGYQIADLAGGAFLAMGVCAALAGRTAEKGGHVQISLLDCQLALLTWQAQNHFVSGVSPGPQGSRSPMTVPSEAFRVSDGRYLAVSPTGTQFWESFCNLIDLPEIIDDPRFATRAARLENVDALSELIAEQLASRGSGEWLEMFAAERVPVAPVLSVDEALRQPVATLRSMVERVPHPHNGDSLEFLGNPFKYENRNFLRYPPAVGENTAEILTDLCGYSDERIRELVATGAIGVKE